MSPLHVDDPPKSHRHCKIKGDTFKPGENIVAKKLPLPFQVTRICLNQDELKQFESQQQDEEEIIKQKMSEAKENFHN